jgi:hypothetical protein
MNFPEYLFRTDITSGRFLCVQPTLITLLSASLKIKYLLKEVVMIAVVGFITLSITANVVSLNPS